MARAARAVLYQLQRLDAFLLDALHANIQRMQDRVHGVLPTTGSHGGPVRAHSYTHNAESLSWTADGLRLDNINDPDVIALQIAPWTFITSPYSYSLIIMAILLNRIQHVVVPTHDPQAGRLGSWFSKFLPIDATATQTRFLLRSASLYLLWKSMILMGAIVLQGFGVFPDNSLFEPLRRRASSSSMVDVCWSSFVAVCVAMAISSFTRGLDGSGPPISSFNLPQFAFLLHLYSSPFGSVFNRVTDALQSQVPALRPNRHILVTLFLPLLQMTMIHTQGTWIKYSRNVLVPTAICGFLGLTHFIYTLYIGQIMEYPLLQVVPSSLELFLIAMILCTTGLNALSQILLQGRITRPLFGAGASSLPGWDEEYAVALVRLGTSSVDATSAAGLGNEVAALSSKSLQEGTIRLGPSGVTSLELPGKRGKRKVVNPFSLEIKHVRAVSAESEMWINITWMRELSKFGLSLWRFVKGVWRMLRGNTIEDIDTPSPTSRISSPVHREPSMLSRRSDVYQRFLAGESMSDHESDSGDWIDHDSSSVSTEDDGSTDHESVDSDGHHTEETNQLYSEHGSQRESTPLAPVLLAHLTTPAGSPLTRRRYSSLLLRRDTDENIGVQPSVVSSPASMSRTGSMDQHGNSEIDADRKMCVICMSSERVVICWPCRCLSMCDDCRSNLASRNGPTKHSCPCCRQTVEGFSRIFIP